MTKGKKKRGVRRSKGKGVSGFSESSMLDAIGPEYRPVEVKKSEGR